MGTVSVYSVDSKSEQEGCMIQPESLQHLMDHLSSNENVCIRYMENDLIQDMTGTQWGLKVKKAAAGLRQRGLGNAHVGIWGANSVDWLISLCAVLYAGAVAVPLCTDWQGAELSAKAHQVDLNAILYDGEINASEDLLTIPMKELQQADDDNAASVRELSSLAMILFTSGTTAVSKAVMLSQKAVLASFCSTALQNRFDSQLAVMPFYHLAGFATAINTLYLGSVVCIAEDVKYIFRDLENMQADYLYAVPSLLKAVTQNPKRRAHRWKLKTISCGGAAFPAGMLPVFHEYGIEIIQNYGASEAGALGLMCIMSMDKPETIGKPVEGVRIQIVEDELFLRSESLMMGYYKDEEETAKVLKDGWYATGDLCRVDADGDVYITGRKRTVIILSNGKNISPEEIESYYAESRCIREIQVFEEQDRLAARVVTEEKSIEEAKEEIAQYNRKVPTYKQIRILHFQSQPLLRNGMGKIVR